MKRSLSLFLFILIFIGCEREFGDYYDPPKGMEGEIYSQLQANPDLSVFVSAIDRLPILKQELSSSGLFTVVAPDNEAFRKYFEGHGEYNSIDDIPVEVLDPFIKYHIIRWMLFQSQFESQYENSGIYKYETRSTVAFEDKLPTGSFKSIYHTPKVLQIYTGNYFSKNNVSSNDYMDVYGQDALKGGQHGLNIMGAVVKQTDISAGNGSCFVIDKVLEPPLNLAQELETNDEYEVYNSLMKKYFVEYTYNFSATMAQGNNGDIDGDGIVDSLWTRKYTIQEYLDIENPRLTEKGITTYYSLSAFIPSKEAFNSYLNNKLLPKFGNIDDVTANTLSVLFKAHVSRTMCWPSRINTANSVVNMNNDVMNISMEDVNTVKIASNGLFYETNKVIEPKAFTGVTGPAFFDPAYSYFAQMLVNSTYLSTLANEDVSYTIFAPSNDAFHRHGIQWLDHPLNNKPGFFRITDNSDPVAISTSEVNRILGNHIVLFTALSTGNMPDGFYPAQNANFVVVENGNIFASERDSVYQITEPDLHMSNGYFHGIDRILYPPAHTIYNKITRTRYNPADPESDITPQFYKFRELCIAAGINSLSNFGGITAPSSGKKFTLFVPSNESIIAAQQNGLIPQTPVEAGQELTTEQIARLENYLRYFFVQEQQILTTGNVIGQYLTASRTPASTPLKDVYYPVTILRSGNTIEIKNINNETATVNVSSPATLLQNMICQDGIIHVIDNAFTSLYNN